VEVERVMTDNGAAYSSTADAWPATRLSPPPYACVPAEYQAGRAERFMRTMLNESLYAAIYQNSEQRRVALAG
jgi:hypothetical protein